MIICLNFDNLQNSLESISFSLEKNVWCYKIVYISNMASTNGFGTGFILLSKVDLSGLPKKFSSQFFKHQQQGMKIWLMMKGLLMVIQVTRPEPTDNDLKTAEIAEWYEHDQLGKG